MILPFNVVTWQYPDNLKNLNFYTVFKSPKITAFRCATILHLRA